MNDEEFRAFMGLLMCSDPYPDSQSNMDILKNYANRIAVDKGFSDWIEAYHKL